MRFSEIVGTWAAGLFLMAFGGAWLGMAYYLSGFGPIGPSSTVLGLAVFGGAFFVFGLFGFLRGLVGLTRRSPLPEGAAGWRDDGERSESDSGFDPDAAIARYLQNRPVADEPAQAEPAPVRPSFGRKQA